VYDTLTFFEGGVGEREKMGKGEKKLNILIVYTYLIYLCNIIKEV